MTWLTAAGMLSAPLVAAWVAGHAPHTMAARRAGIAGALVALAFAALGFWFRASQGAEGALRNLGAILPLFVAVIGWVSVSMTRASASTPGTIVRLLLTNAASLGLVLVEHPLAVAAFYGLTLLPAWLELASREGTRDAARVFAVYLLPSAALFATGALLAARGLTAASVVPFALAIAVREAVIPFHTWLPIFVERAPLGMTATLVAPQVGVYCHLNLLSEVLPPDLANFGALLGALTAVYAACMGVAQVRTRRALGYLIMSQTGLLAFGLDARADVARVGTLAAWLVSGLAMAGFAMAIEALEARRGPLDLGRPSGAFHRVPRLAASFLVLGLASVGVPGTLGFVAEDLLVQGSVGSFPVLAFALIAATALNGVTVVRNFFILFTGSSRHTGERDLTRREGIVLTVVLAALVGSGIWPAPVVGSLTRPADGASLAGHR